MSSMVYHNKYSLNANEDIGTRRFDCWKPYSGSDTLEEKNNPDYLQFFFFHVNTEMAIREGSMYVWGNVMEIFYSYTTDLSRKNYT